MQLELTRYRQPLGHFSRTFQAGDLGPDEDAYRIVAPVQLDFDIHKDKDRFRLEGTVKTELELSCSRCLEPFTMPVATDFDLRYVPRAENAGDGEKEVEEDDLATAFYDNDEIDLSQLMTEQFQLALPMKPLCTDACKGLCAQCGTNLNTGACDCSPKWEDPRFAALKSMKHTD